jgi:beta-glucanase (GH16 family)
MPTGDVPGWHQVFADNFTQNVPVGQFPGAVSSSWGNSYPDGWKDTSGAGTYMPSKVVSIANGVMNLNLHTENGVHMVAAPVPTLPTMTYGRYVIRFRSDAIPGYKTAWLLWPDSEVWPHDGEIDFPEGNLTGSVWGVVHHQGSTSGSDQALFSTHVTYTGWHTATLTWLPSAVTFQLDGRTVGTTRIRIPNTPMHLVIQSETSIGGPPPANSAAGNIQIDWLAIYRRA